MESIARFNDILIKIGCNNEQEKWLVKHCDLSALLSIHSEITRSNALFCLRKLVELDQARFIYEKTKIRDQKAFKFLTDVQLILLQHELQKESMQKIEELQCDIKKIKDSSFFKNCNEEERAKLKEIVGQINKFKTRLKDIEKTIETFRLISKLAPNGNKEAGVLIDFLFHLTVTENISNQKKRRNFTRNMPRFS